MYKFILTIEFIVGPDLNYTFLLAISFMIEGSEFNKKLILHIEITKQTWRSTAADRRFSEKNGRHELYFDYSFTGWIIKH